MIYTYYLINDCLSKDDYYFADEYKKNPCNFMTLLLSVAFHLCLIKHNNDFKLYALKIRKRTKEFNFNSFSFIASLKV